MYIISCTRIIGIYIILKYEYIYRQALQSSARSPKISAYLVFDRVCIVHGYENVAIGD